ncbi:structural maintenance of chromosomes protein 6, partial [Tremellales sp. Uapishka_1]
MARASSKRRSEEGSDEERETSHIKRVKRERQETALLTPISDEDHDEEMGQLSSSSSSDEDEAEPLSDSDIIDDAENMRALEAVKRRMGKYVGEASEAGILKSISLVNFMCHKHLSLDFGKKMNFLCGRNGSGKSAVLTAIAVALGAKASITGRGSGLKDLIRKNDDCDRATVILTLHNTGSEAFKPDLYKPDIVIERTIMKNGSSSYKFRGSKNGKVLASSKEELTQISNAFNITIDSPLTLLTQDQARSFLQSSDDKTMYQFFLKGTQLQALSEQYTESSRSILLLENTIIKNRAAIPDLQIKVASLQRELESSQKIIDMKAKRTKIIEELAWSYVIRKEIEHKEGVEKVDELTEKIDKIDESVAESKEQVEVLTGQITQVQEEVNKADESKKPLQAALETAKKKFDQGRTELRKLDIKDKKKEIRSQEADIEARTKAANIELDPRILELRRKIDGHDSTLRKLHAELPVKEQAVVDKTEIHDKAEREVERLDRRLGDVSTKLHEVNRTIDDLEQTAKSKANAFGSRMDLVLNEIKNARWNHSPPLGPLGLYVKLEDHTYIKPVHALLGSLLCSFAVKHQADKRQLMAILQKCSKQGYRPGNNRRGPPSIPVIYTHSGDRYDFSAGDMSRRATTVLSVLRIDNEEVLRILVDNARIEQTFLSPTQKSADVLATQFQREGIRNNILDAEGYLTNAPNSTSKTTGPQGDWHGENLFTKDIALDLRSKRQSRESLNVEIEDTKRRKRDAVAASQQAFNDLTKARVYCFQCVCLGRTHQPQGEADRVRKGIPGLSNQIEKLRDDLAAEHRQTDIDVMQAALDEIKIELHGVEDLLPIAIEERKECSDSVKILQDRWREKQTEVEGLAPMRKKTSDALQKLIVDKEKLELELKYRNNSRATTEAQLVKAKEKVVLSQNDLVVRLLDPPSMVLFADRISKSWTVKAGKFCDRVETNAKPEDLTDKRTAIDKTIVEAEKRTNVNTNEVMRKHKAASEQLDAANLGITDFEKLKKGLERSLLTRKQRWETFRKHIAIRARTNFIVNLSKRNFEGRLEFDHVNQLLAVRVQSTGSKTGEAANEDGELSQTQSASARYKNAKILSGGERSFSTVSLLLSLWDTVACPIRCLDEWDVFLDQVNRGLAAKLLCEGAAESDGKQFILITPQDMSGISTGGTDNKLHVLDAPERGQ